uniref:I-set domain-containing protein n=1 Tax=Angiostrongylus cantonensis TaxID=6313 RepID=A0A0K0CXX2_ANGCA
MLPSLYAALSLSIIYRISVNLPDLPYSADLQNIGSHGFLQTSNEIARTVDRLLANLPGHHSAAVFQYRYHKDLGTLVYLDVYSNNESSFVKKRFMEAIKNGWLGPFRISSDGFELHIIRGLLHIRIPNTQRKITFKILVMKIYANSYCSPTEFRCSNGTCISVNLRCDGKQDCEDGSDERIEYGMKTHCRGSIVIYQQNRIVYAPSGAVALLSAIIDEIPKDHQVLWSRNNNVIGEGALTTSSDVRFTVYSVSPEYFLRIENVSIADEGEYTITVSGMGVNATYEVRKPLEIFRVSEECPENERLCRSGHCLAVSQFCNRVVECPDGDDEDNCTSDCSPSEFRCKHTNSCVPSVVRCDGWNDCHDSSDEQVSYCFSCFSQHPC